MAVLFKYLLLSEKNPAALNILKHPMILFQCVLRLKCSNTPKHVFIVVGNLSKTGKCQTVKQFFCVFCFCFSFFLSFCLFVCLFVCFCMFVVCLCVFLCIFVVCLFVAVV